MPQLWGLDLTFCPRSIGCSALMPGHYPTLSTLTSDTTTECWLKTSSRRAQFLQEHMKGNNGHWQRQNQPNTLESFPSEWNIVTKQMHAKKKKLQLLASLLSKEREIYIPPNIAEAIRWLKIKLHIRTMQLPPRATAIKEIWSNFHKGKEVLDYRPKVQHLISAGSVHVIKKLYISKRITTNYKLGQCPLKFWVWANLVESCLSYYFLDQTSSKE